MTICVYRDGVLAADSRIADSDTAWGNARKLIRTANGSLACAAGDLQSVTAFLTWAYAKRRRGKAPLKESEGLIIRPNGAVMLYEGAEFSPVTGPYFAIGSGSDVALGALFMGADAITAVRAAIKHNTQCGAPILALTLCTNDPEEMTEYPE